ncbi:MAG TPA: acetyltransferase, partial [Nitrolancea sp.]|nr:acetyltransferase [Nitrolancea sp.]
HEVVGYTVDDAYAQQSEFMGRPVIPFSRIEHELPPNEVRMFIPLGFQRMNALRAKKFDEAGKKGYSFASYVSSRICAVEYPQIGENCLILEANVFNYDVTIGNDVVIWSGNHVGDLCVIEDHVWISSHAVLSGEVTIGSHTFVGVNASVSNYVKIGPRSYIGACALITQDTAPDSVYVDKATPKLGIDSQRFLGMTKS